ncbi:MAG: Rne/Rng family ribonuclease [Sedimentisphaerales bacterium]|nr:Rne/Rng family ribonuclease [Sedimentisphaerales bacterium]
MARELLINVAQQEECRIAVVDNGVLEELYIEWADLPSLVGNIYKGRVVNIEPGIQAAFIDIGTGTNGFLHISDLHSRYFPGAKPDTVEAVGHRKALASRPPIQDCLRRGQQVIVQVTKDGLKSKGPTLTTYLALPGKYVVLMPWMRHHGISHKIEQDEQRRRLHQILSEISIPADMGCIIRTAGAEASKKDIQNDLKYLLRVWESISARIKSQQAPCELYRESDLVTRTLRDVFDHRIHKIVCDSEPVIQRIKDFLSQAYPRLKPRIVYYHDQVPLFHKYQIEQQISKIQSKVVPLPSGGSIVIEQTEALVAIDVNSGKHHGPKNAAQMAFETNLEAAVEIARQLRLRDLGGLIVCDFIDMRDPRHRKEVERVFKQAMKADRAKTKILPISRFGIVEMTRQRMRSSIQSQSLLACPHCNGTGFVKSYEMVAVDLIRLLRLALAKKQVAQIELLASPQVAEYLQNEKRATLANLEQATEKKILIRAMPDYGTTKYELICTNERGSQVKFT